MLLILELVNLITLIVAYTNEHTTQSNASHTFTQPHTPLIMFLLIMARMHYNNIIATVVVVGLDRAADHHLNDKPFLTL